MGELCSLLAWPLGMPSRNPQGHVSLAICGSDAGGREGGVGGRVFGRGLGQNSSHISLPRPISFSWSPYGEPFLLRNAWKIFSLAWPMVSQSRTLTEMFRQTSALSFSGIFSKTTFNACKNTNKFPSLLDNWNLKGTHKRHKPWWALIPLTAYQQTP